MMGIDCVNSTVPPNGLPERLDRQRLAASGFQGYSLQLNAPFV
jgi:hypothetical protein